MVLAAIYCIELMRSFQIMEIVWAQRAMRGNDCTLSQVIEYTGDAVAGVDVDDADAMANIAWGSAGADRHFTASGCDFFYEITFADDSVKRIAIEKGSFRDWNQPTSAPHAEAAQVGKWRSFR